MTDVSYVNHGAWLRAPVREDAIDDIADQFERPVQAGAEVFWSDLELRRAATVHATTASFVPRAVERRAG